MTRGLHALRGRLVCRGDWIRRLQCGTALNREGSHAEGIVAGVATSCPARGRMRLGSAAVMICATLSAVVPACARADSNGFPIAVAPEWQQYQMGIPDGAGGAIVVWQDGRNETGASFDIYAHHVLGSGTVDPTWPANGLAVCRSHGTQQFPYAIGDGAGGAVVTWMDQRGGSYDVYAQHVLSSGTVDPAWPVNGRDWCTAVGNQQTPRTAPDGSGGFFVVWEDARVSPPDRDWDIYAQHVLPSGVADPTWPTNGIPICTAPGKQFLANYGPSIVADGNGGAIVTWYDNRLPGGGIVYRDIYAQHILGVGVDPAWPVNGRAVCAAGGAQDSPWAAADGAGGAFIAWRDYRAGDINVADTYAQHILSTGVPDPAWPADGQAICTAPGNQDLADFVGDGAGGALILWSDRRTGNYDVYAQHVLSNGAIDPAWVPDGSPINTATGDQYAFSLASDGGGGFFVAWTDDPTGARAELNIGAQHVLANGLVDPLWPLGGLAVCTAPGYQLEPIIVPNGAGGAILAWSDARDAPAGDPWNSDIYGASIFVDQPTPTLLSLADYETGPGRVTLRWQASDATRVQATVDRRSTTSEWEELGTPSLVGTDYLLYEDQTAPPGRTGYRLRYFEDSEERFTEETWLEVPSSAQLSLAGFRPNPAISGAGVAFSLPDGAPATLEVHDVRGREVFAREVGSLGPGSHVLPIDGQQRLSAGVYWIRLVHWERTLISKGIVAR